ncbi:MAG: hypothetical protein F6J95_005875 [Leptolyngbya sp. SIO1E4]|nr:hypothetical protein [Leptolyngbya sp. SIO1E4]
MLVVIHTFTEVTPPPRCKIRIISARRANTSEIKQYQGDL